MWTLTQALCVFCLWSRLCSSMWPASWGRDTRTRATVSATWRSPRRTGRTRGARHYETLLLSTTAQTVFTSSAAQKCVHVYNVSTVSFCTSLMFTTVIVCYFITKEKNCAVTFKQSTLFLNLNFAAGLRSMTRQQSDAHKILQCIVLEHMLTIQLLFNV